MPRFITGLDIGSSQIKAVVAQQTKDGIAVRHVVKTPSRGVRKGVVHNVSEAASCVSHVLEEIREVAKKAPRNSYLNISSPKVNAVQSRGTAAVSRADNEIEQEDIDRAKKSSRAVSVSRNRTVIHALTQEFIVDDIKGVASPLGLSGTRLEVMSMVIDVFSPHVDALVQATELAGGSVEGIFLSPLAASRSALSPKQKELGVVLVDIGFGTTSVAVYEEDQLLALKVFPVGAGNVTNDIAVGLKIPVDVAETIKLHYGHALPRSVNRKDKIELGDFMEGNDTSASRRFIAEIISARMTEILEFVNNELKMIGKSGQLAGGVVLTGGGAKLPGLCDLARDELKLTSQIGFGNIADWKKGDSIAALDDLEDPDMVDALGLALFGTEQEEWWKNKRPRSPKSIRKLLQYFMP